MTIPTLLGANTLQLCLAVLSVFVVSGVLRYRKNLRAVHLPGLRIALNPLEFGKLFPSSRWNPGPYLSWAQRHSIYKEFGNETYSVVPFLPFDGPAYYTSNLDVVRQLIGGEKKTSFTKPKSVHLALSLWGENIFVADGDLWRKHRRIIGPAFNNDLYQMIWNETIKRYREMVVKEGWESKKEIDVPVVQDLTFKLALLTIAKCGFGLTVDWFEPPRSVGEKMSVQQALRITTDPTLVILCPKWFLNLPFKKLRVVRDGHEQMTSFMKSQVAERKAEVRSKSEDELGSDIFTRLIKANENETGKLRLDDSELIGNIYMMLFAGHETTAHTLAAALGFMAYYPEIQAEVLQQILDIVGISDPDDYPKLDKVLEVFYETLRMYPSGFHVTREAAEDTTLTIPNPHGQEGTTVIHVPKGVQVVGDMIGVQYNPRYFEDPEQFRPSRWHGVSADSEMFSAFSVGARSCIGRKFATVESICFLTMLLRDYEVLPKLKSGETKEAWRERVMGARLKITLGIMDIPLRFVKRA